MDNLTPITGLIMTLFESLYFKILILASFSFRWHCLEKGISKINKRAKRVVPIGINKLYSYFVIYVVSILRRVSARKEGQSVKAIPSPTPMVQNDEAQVRGKMPFEGSVSGANKSAKTGGGRKWAAMLFEKLDSLLEFINERNKRKACAIEPAPSLADALAKLLTFDLETSLFSFAYALMENP
ncbi:LOW QUALITY PROTEIN: hypothetical protein Cgig2_017569 [Carnegiea gigantea]|uniref:Uncharacterized protein n=1 Tax=Carnegiea gigantea TaxID=171969 RepID=A0A9Q1QKU8_9CARY|nr:LOW QUALITY PROTEIN: hypothetical protein Cgig2_017569 [Carnegiea gigantea]